jgi:tetratricopeptide (TPR) repeat protein
MSVKMNLLFLKTKITTIFLLVITTTVLLYCSVVFVSCNSASQGGTKTEKQDQHRSSKSNQLTSIFHPDKELARLDSIITADKDNISAIEYKVILLLQMKRNAEAIAIEEQLVARKATAGNMMLLGTMYEKCNQDSVTANKFYKRSLDAYDSLRGKPSGDEFAEVSRIQLISFLYGKDKAISEYRKVLKQYPKSRTIANAKHQIMEVSRQDYIKSLW